MARFFARDDDLKRITLEGGPLDGEWILIRSRISHAEEQRLAGGMFTGVREGGEGKPQTLLMDATAFDIQRIRHWVRGWSLTVSERLGDVPQSVREADRRWQDGSKPSNKELEELLPEAASQILAAITAHEDSLKVDNVLALDPLPATGGTGTTASSIDEPQSYTTP